MAPASMAGATGVQAAADIEVPVLIVGGSMVGMTAAVLLGHHGVRSLVVEHHRGTAIHPRAASVTQRTMEIFRSVGLDEVVRARSEAQFVQDAGVVTPPDAGVPDGGVINPVTAFVTGLVGTTNDTSEPQSIAPIRDADADSVPALDAVFE